MQQTLAAVASFPMSRGQSFWCTHTDIRLHAVFQQMKRLQFSKWLSQSGKKPQSQEQYSRRHYVRKTFTLGEDQTLLLAKAKGGEDNNRSVVTIESIAEVVEAVHQANDLGGWDRTWEEVSPSFYDILRADVIFLLRRCQTCSTKPLKRPKGSGTAAQTGHDESTGLFDLLQRGVWNE